MSHPPTGPGRVTTDANAPVGGVRAVLSNFDVDVDALKPEHTAFLDRAVLPILTGGNARIWLQGQASHTGGGAHNMELSHRRALRVVEYLRGRGVPQQIMQVDWVGDSLAGPRRQELAVARAVSLLAVKLGSPPPVVAPPPATPVAAMNTTFQIRMLAGLSGGFGPLLGERLFFQIWDQRNAVTCFYLFASQGLGKGLGAAISGTMRGPWNTFTTTGPLNVGEFEGAARFSSSGVGPWSVNELNMMSMPRGTATIPRVLSISTGFTLGLGMSSTIGSMVAGYCGPFTGP